MKATNEELLARIEELEAELAKSNQKIEQYESGNYWISVAEAAEILGVHRNRVLQLVSSDLIDGKKIGNTWIICRASVESRAANPPSAGRRWEK